MARRERRACPQQPVRSEQRSQTAQSSLAIWVAPLFHLFRRCSSIIPPLRDGYAHSSRLGETKNRRQHGMAGYFNRLLSSDPVQKTKWPSRGTATLLPASRGPGRCAGIRLVNFLDNAAPHPAHRELLQAALPWCRRPGQTQSGQRGSSRKEHTH